MQAVQRAEQMDKAAEEAGEPGRNPTTGVYKLTELIRIGMTNAESGDS